MRVGLLAVWVLGGCYEQNLAVGGDPAPDGGDPGACPEPRGGEPVEIGPIGADEIPAWVEGRSQLVEDDPVPRCLADDPGSDEQYGCRDEDGWCVPTADRVRVTDGMMVVSLGAQCANARSPEIPEVRIDGLPVAPNRVLWTIEIGIPVAAIDPGETIELWDTPCAWVAFKWRDWVIMEADACGHEPHVVIQADGLRIAWCRQEWRPFRADVGSDPGLLAHSRVTVSSADPSEGDTFGLSVNLGGCGSTELAEVSGDGNPVPMICCSNYAEHWLEWTVGSGGALHGPAGPSAASGCCWAAEQDPQVDARGDCGRSDPGWW